MSEDGTRKIVESYCRKYDFIRLLDNVEKITPTALNIGIKNASGDIVMRMDAHAVYPGNYIRELTDWLQKSGADNVGGVCLTLPGNDSVVANAISMGLSHPFGVGNSYFRIGTA